MGGQQQQEQENQTMEYQEMGFNNNGVHVQWLIMEPQTRNNTSETESVSSIGEDSDNNSGASTSSQELEEDASSSSSSSSTEFGPLYELSDLMNQLPIKRGLSKIYQGKSQSFTSLANVKSFEDLAKKVGPYSQRMKSCKSFAGGLDGHHKFGPKATIAKKRGSSSSSSSFASLRRGNLVGSFRQQRDY